MNVPGGEIRYVVMQNAAVATGNGLVLPCTQVSDGAYSIAAFSIEGISGDTITFEATIDKTNWYAVLAENMTTGIESTTATADGIYRVTVAGMVDIRTRISTYSAGTIQIIGLVTT